MTAKPRNRGITVVRTSNNANRPADLEQLAPEAAAVICKKLNAREFAKLGEPRTWFDLQGAAAYLVVSEQTLSRYVKSRFKDGVGFDPLPNHKNAFPSAKSDGCTINGGSSHD